MPDEIVRIRIPAGHDLGKSHQVAGAFSANSFGADGPGGPVVIFRDLPQGKKEIVQVSPGLTGFQRIAPQWLSPAPAPQGPVDGWTHQFRRERRRLFGAYEARLGGRPREGNVPSGGPRW